MPDQQRWIIDGIEDEVARLEVEGERTITLPRALLPAAARDGLVLTVRREPEGRDRVTITIEIDRDATTAARRASKAQVAAIEAESKKRDGGGDVKL